MYKPLNYISPLEEISLQDLTGSATIKKRSRSKIDLRLQVVFFFSLLSVRGGVSITGDVLTRLLWRTESMQIVHQS